MKFLIIGHARHGKDTVAELMRIYWGLTFQSSSEAALEIFLAREMYERHGYISISECMAHKEKHREEWKQLITEYNTPDKARLCRSILLLNGNDAYIGMRCQDEYEASKHLFSEIFWVDASQRVPPDPTMTIQYDPDMITIDNNGTPSDLDSIIKSPSVGHLLGRI